MLFDDYVLFLVGFVIAGICLSLAIGITRQLDN